MAGPGVAEDHRAFSRSHRDGAPVRRKGPAANLWQVGQCYRVRLLMAGGVPMPHHVVAVQRDRVSVPIEVNASRAAVSGQHDGVMKQTALVAPGEIAKVLLTRSGDMR